MFHAEGNTDNTSILNCVGSLCVLCDVLFIGLWVRSCRMQKTALGKNQDQKQKKTHNHHVFLYHWNDFFFTFVFMSKEIFILKACKAKRKISFSACFWRFLHFLKSPWKDAKKKCLEVLLFKRDSLINWQTLLYLSALSLSLSLSLSHPRLITRIWTWTLIFKVYFKLKRIDFGI